MTGDIAIGFLAELTGLLKEKGIITDEELAQLWESTAKNLSKTAPEDKRDSLAKACRACADDLRNSMAPQTKCR